jgi:sucrose synthase
MENLLHMLIGKKDRQDFKELINFFAGSASAILLRNDIIQLFRDYCDQYKKSKSFRTKSSIFLLIKKIQELFFTGDHLTLMHRYAIAKYHYYLIRMDGEYIEEITLSEYLDRRDHYTHQTHKKAQQLRIDFMPFYDFSPIIRDVRSVGRGIRFLNRYMSSNIFSRPKEWLEKAFNFLKIHQYEGQQLLLNGAILNEPNQFLPELEKALDWIRTKPANTPYSRIKARLKKSGFEVGWGNTAGRIQETMQLLLDLVGEPTDELLRPLFPVSLCRSSQESRSSHLTDGSDKPMPLENPIPGARSFTSWTKFGRWKNT